MVRSTVQAEIRLNGECSPGKGLNGFSPPCWRQSHPRQSENTESTELVPCEHRTDRPESLYGQSYQAPNLTFDFLYMLINMLHQWYSYLQTGRTESAALQTLMMLRLSLCTCILREWYGRRDRCFLKQKHCVPAVSGIGEMSWIFPEQKHTSLLNPYLAWFQYMPRIDMDFFASTIQNNCISNLLWS